MHTEGRVISGLAAPYYDGTPGSQYELFPGVFERYMPGCFDGTIQQDCVLLWNHDANYPLGRTTANTLRLFETARGLEFESTIEKDSIWASEVVRAIRRGDVRGASVAMLVEDDLWRFDRGVEVRELHKVRLLDVSPVTYPAYESTKVVARSRADAVRYHLADAFDCALASMASC